MAATADVDHFLSQSIRAGIEKDLAQPTKDSLGSLLDSYTSAGYTHDDLARVIDENTPSSALSELTPVELTEAVETLVLHVEAESTATGTDSPAPEETPDAIAEALAVELGADLTEAFAAEEEELMALMLAKIVAEIGPDVRAELAGTPEFHGSGDDVLAARSEAVYLAVLEAVGGLCEAVEKEGGYVALLTESGS